MTILAHVACATSTTMIDVTKHVAIRAPSATAGLSAMAKHRSIGYRIEKPKTLAVRREVAQDWSANWYADHLQTIHKLEKALQARDIAGAGQYCGQLKALHEKGFGAISRVIDALTDEDIA